VRCSPFRSFHADVPRGFAFDPPLSSFAWRIGIRQAGFCLFAIKRLKKPHSGLVTELQEVFLVSKLFWRRLCPSGSFAFHPRNPRRAWFIPARSSHA
jgi:hypothetical protein